MKKNPNSLVARFKRAIFAYGFLTIFLWSVYYAFWGRHLYLVTAYCNCPICINVKKYQDDQFASGRRIYWGGMAADPRVPFGTTMELVPHWPQDWLAVFGLLKGKRKFRVEDRGGKIKGKHLDLFIPDSMGGHKTARQWGVRRMRVKVNGDWANG
ncbi:MAG: 3D domain-containing protein [Candidatus Omnitrophica bacterium]|nr:3D domain-containing protein [Candidatus Omnitrophota bacterium]